MKQCAICLEEKPLDNFSPNKWNQDGRTSYCRPCRNQQHRLKYDSSIARNSYLQYKYGITQKQYDDMLAKQNGRCAICFALPQLQSRGRCKTRMAVLDVDHDHQTGEIRGLLCHACNSMLAFLEGRIHALENILAYLGRTKLKKPNVIKSVVHDILG